ncbi:MAG TPA: amino acid adenylation domain-containing protein [Bryobacteraceae bacterium]|nr:amino acid adenylation domain-containing protein [Bryobacteraceae bacterium]
MDGVAIIGMAGRFPGARNAAQFWSNLRSGVESISHFRADELEVEDAARLAQDPSYVSARSILDDVDLFDADFFGIYPQEAKFLDPQHRVFLECCWEAMEDAGHDLSNHPSVTGVFAGCSPNSYFLRQIAESTDYLREYTSAYQVGFYPTMLGTIADTMATRVAYKLNLKGPAMTLLAACSTSLVAVCQAAKSLLTYECDQALAGAVSITFPQKRGYLHQDGGMASPDGHCRAFDEDAQGTVFGSGAGVVLLKRLEDAVRDRDHIYAVIKGSAVNNDGAQKVGFTAPSVDGQAAVIAMAQALAGVDPRTISYIEAHGTGTPLGDPIELAALTKVFRESTPDRGFCAIGTAKANVGHLDVASGVTGLIKTALSLDHGELPPQINFRKPNPKLQLEDSPFYVSTKLRPWESNDGNPRRAGVSAFGVGGTNAHVVLEEAPLMETRISRRPYQILSLSARSEEALRTARERLAGHLSNADSDLASVAYTLQTGRRQFPYRQTLVCRTREEAVRALQEGKQKPERQRENAAVYFLFPGQGTQHVHMGQEVYAAEPVYRENFDHCCEIFKAQSGTDLREIIFAASDVEEAARRLNATALAQPAIFATEYALAKLWMSWGLEPKGMLGHSIGEFVAACLAGVLTLDDAVRLVATRGRLMQDLPGGAMLSVRLPEAEVRPLLNGDLSIAALNAPMLTVVSGPHEAVAKLEGTLKERGAMSRRLHTSHAFHSAMMDPILAPFTEAVRKVKLSAPAIPYLSCVTGTWITAEQATDAAYWASHFRQAVRFSDAVQVLRRDATGILLEVGPGTTLQVLARQHAQAAGDAMIVSSLPDAAAENSALATLYGTLGRLWEAGFPIDWTQFYAGESLDRIPLPTYPFERKRYWAEPADRRSTTQEAYEEAAPSLPNTPEKTDMKTAVDGGRKSRIIGKLASMFAELSGMEAGEIDSAATFLELGFDSLFLTQVSQSLQGGFGVKITFRQLLDQLSTIDALAGYLDEQLPPEPAEQAKPAPADRTVTAPVAAASEMGTIPAALSGGIEQILRDQLKAMSDLMNRQLDVLRGAGAPAATSAAQPVLTPGVAAPAAPQRADAQKPEQEFKPFGPYKPVQKGATGGLTPRQEAHLHDLIERYTKRTAGSKQHVQRYRKVLADPRVASGFRSQWKEMVYPLVTNRSRGSRLWDIDGNEYIDLLNGFGPTAFGHLPEFVNEAVAKQLSDGIEIGPQTPLAGEVAELISELTGVERVTFCNTGSEAVMAGLRVARTVTARKKIALFAGAYHGTFDEVLVKRIGKLEALRSGPIAPGIPQEKVQNVMVLDYGAPESLEIIRQHASELAAVLVEPVQSRHPSLQPKEFLHELRRITEASGTALIIDEIVTGFRAHPGGVQALFDVKADLVTYGKVLGGGMPIGVLAGRAAFMDALDGGMWQYGDASFPEVGVTFFAGTFVRHPLALAAAKAVLLHLKANGAALQERLTARTKALVDRLNGLFERHNVPSRIETFGSVFYFSFPSDFRFGSLLYYHLREKGIHIQEGFPCFLTTAHTDEDLDRVVRAFEQSVEEMAAGELWPQATGDAIAAAPVEALREAPLTEAQLEIWLSAQLSVEASCSYNEAFTLELKGELNEAALRESIQKVIDRHDGLRATFDTEGKMVHFASELKVDIPAVDLSAEPEADGAFTRMVEEDAQTPFDLNAGPLVRARLVRLGPNRHKLLFTSHHIVCDGWSANVILDEVAKLYTGKLSNTVAKLDPVLPFAAYATAQRALASAPEHAAVESYWLEQFAERPPVLDLPTDRPRPALKGFAGSTERRKIGKALHHRLKKAGAKQGCTLFATLLGGFQALLMRLSAQDDVVVGIPAAAQSLEEGKSLVGHCVNFLPLRARLAEEETFADFLKRGKRTLLDAYEHQQYTYGTLVRKLGIQRDPSRLPLIEVQFNLERVGAVLDFQGLAAEMDSCAKRYVNFDLFLNIVETDDGLVMDCDYNTDLFDQATVSRWLGHYETLLAGVAEDMNRPARRLPLLQQAEIQELVVGRNRTEAGYPSQCVHELFEQQAASTPNAVALVCGRETLTYGELQARSAELAAFLQKQGVSRGQLVGICLERSAEMVVAMLAVLRAGGAYVPLDPAYPKARLDFILGEAGVRVLLTQERVAVELTGVKARMICLDSEKALIAREKLTEKPQTTADDLAYVIYTSGSTGRPKGVEIQHRAVVNFLASIERQLGIEPSDRLVAVTTLSFDIAGLELLLPLVSGARVVIAPRESTLDGTLLAELIKDSGATVLQATPSTWRLLLEAGWKPQPRFKMLCGGEALPRDLADQLLNTEGELWNMYGPTETTIWSAISLVNEGPAPVRIGPPIANTQFYVLDRYAQPVPMGIPGELYIGGDGVARGYFQRPELTREKFLEDPFRGGNRMYRTGDLVRTLPDGSLDFLGRLDNQVKIRGFRIELGEIETVLLRSPAVKDAVVIAHGEAGAQKLVAYLATSDGAEADKDHLRDLLSAALPAYMVPAAFVTVSSIPRLPNGKVNRRGLPEPDFSRGLKTRQAPRNKTEESLGRIVCEVLRLEDVSMDDNLFELGADSIQIFQIVARANRAGIGATAQELLRHPSIEGFARVVAGGGVKSKSGVSQIRPVSRERYRVEPGTLSR